MPVLSASRRVKVSVVGVVGAIVVAILLLLLRNCHQTVALATPPFDYFVAKATELGNDPVRIVAYVRDQVPTLEYRGDVKGALGALWNGAASPEEKVLLAQALLAAAGAGKQVSLDEICPGHDKKLDGSPPIQLVIVHRIDLPGPPKDMQVYSGPPGALVGDVHSVEMAVSGKTRITLRTAAQAPIEIAIPENAEGESLVFKWQVPTASKAIELTTVRELWHRGNRSGARGPDTGDRHDFAILPCVIGPYVVEKEAVLLKQRQRDSSIEAPAYQALLAFAMASDGYLAGIEKQMKVVAQRSEPRILIWSRYKSLELPEGYACALDARIDRVDFAGERIAAYRASQVRSFLESALVSDFVEHRSALPSYSAFGVFSMLRSDVPGTFVQRIAQIRDTLESLEQERSLDSVATFAVQEDGQPGGTGKAKVAAQWTVNGIQVRRVPPARDVPGTLSQAVAKLTDSDANVYQGVEDASAAIEAFLLSADSMPRVSPEYVLETQIARKPMSLVQPGARFLLQWMEDSVPTEQQIRMLEVGPGLEYQWRVQAGVLPVAGTREVSADALNTATVHNPWYRAGSSVQRNETSFVLSRKVYAAIRDGKGISLQVQGALGSRSDAPTTRPVEFTDTLSPGETTTIEPAINGKPEKLKILQATIRGKPMAILDDPAFPVGMAHAIKSVVTAVHCRLVDGRDQPIGGARVAVSTREQPTQFLSEGGPTAPDGLFLLSPPDQGDSLGKVVLQVTFADKAIQRVNVDLTAPGLSIIVVKVDKPATKLLYLGRNDQRQLDALKVSDEVKRHARRDLEAGHLVVIPAQEVGDGFGMHSAYYACDNQTGDCVGIMESGLCGAATWDEVMPDETPATTADTMQTSPQSPTDTSLPRWQKMLPGWHAAVRALPEEKDSKVLFSQMLRAMRGWAQVTDAGGTFGDLADDALGQRLTAALKVPALNTSGNSAKPVFQIGFISSTRYLAQSVENSDGK